MNEETNDKLEEINKRRAAELLRQVRQLELENEELQYTIMCMKKNSYNWISIKDKLPLDGDIVPILFNGILAYGIYSKQHGFLYQSRTNYIEDAMTLGIRMGQKIEVDYWMEIPRKFVKES